jgi:hypothetical protein
MTRADFYVGTGTNAKYLGSIFSDGGTVPNSIKRARTPEKFEKAVAKYIKKENGSTQWPWPWETSVTTDFSYWLEDEKLYVLDFGKGVKIIEKKRGRPASFERDWEMPVMTPAVVVLPSTEIHSDIAENDATVRFIDNVLETPDGTRYTVGQGALTDPNLKLTLS